MMNVQQRLTLADKILIGGLILLSLAGYPFVRQFVKEGDTVEIEVDGKVYATVSLHSEQTLFVPGPLGHTEVVIQDGNVFVKDSPCRARICIRTGPITHGGHLIACVPNKVVVRVVGTKDSELPYDAVTR